MYRRNLKDIQLQYFRIFGNSLQGIWPFYKGERFQKTIGHLIKAYNDLKFG